MAPQELDLVIREAQLGIGNRVGGRGHCRYWGTGGAVAVGDGGWWW
jgi:hypothetical protein